MSSYYVHITDGFTNYYVYCYSCTDCLFAAGLVSIMSTEFVIFCHTDQMIAKFLKVNQGLLIFLFFCTF